MQNLTAELEQEQAYVTMLYRRLDTLRERAQAALERALAHDGGGNLQALVDRDAFVARHSRRLAQLNAAEHGLCFGRLDRADGSHLYIGRLGLLDDDREPLLVDWRAPAAQPFYQATWAAPDGVVRRRHLRTRGRTVLGIEDDVVDPGALSDAERDGLSGEAALLAALTASRTGRMSDIVATIQAEQDRIIRSDLPGVLVVQGGPGTGKTAVALHRAAYLLYTHRQRLARRGVLVVGPNPTFLRYIEQVLPSLGETDVLLSTVGGLFPGVAATAQEPVEVAAVKGDPRMVEVLASAIADRQRVPEADIVVEVGGQRLRLDRATCAEARRRARAAGTPHNQARSVFRRELVLALADQLVAALTRDLPEVDLPDDDLLVDLFPDERLLDPDLDEIRAELAAAPAVRSAVDRLWPRLTAQQLVGGLLASPERLAAAGGALDEAERALLARPAAGDGDPGWTPADVPLLDEAAVLLGDDGASARRAEARQAERERAELAYAREVLANVTIGDAARYTPDTDAIDPARFADRQRPRGPRVELAERAGQDRGWVFGHVIVDEAQELSPMAWRMLMRRSPSRSMTVVGDIAQTGAPWGPASWAEVLDRHAAGRWRVERLTVNYRTPAEIMAVAADVLASLGGGLEPPRSARDGGGAPWRLGVGAGELAARLPGVVAAEAAAVGDGRLAVLVPAGRAGELAGAIGTVLPAATAGQGPSVLDARVAVLTVGEAKGLEFDAVVVVDPAAILAGGPHGANDLYVALTRTTARLGVVHLGDLPAVLARLVPGPAVDPRRRTSYCIDALIQRRVAVSQELWWAFAAVAVACLWLAVAAVLAARRPLDPAAVAAWASGHGLRGLPARQLEPAGRYLRRSRRFRTVGGAVPFALGTAAPALWAATMGLPAPWPLGLFGARSWLAGYLAGVLLAEYGWARPRVGVVRSAALVPRRLGDYLPARVVLAMRLAALAVAALVPVVAWGPVAPAEVRGLLLGGRGGALATAAVALAVATGVELLARRVVGRPQAAADAGELAVDDALRATSVQAAAGAGLAIVLLSLSVQVGLVAAGLAGGAGRTAVVALSWGCAAAALAAWARVGHPRRWTVRRVAVPAAGDGRPVILHLRTDSPVPPYEQLRAQIATMVASGVLAPGARLPTIRQLAGDLGLAGGTVTRAYRELERDGVISGRGRHGTFVRDRPPAPVQEPDLGRRLEEAARWFAVQARQLGADPSTALDRARDALDALPS